jgi:hypothetical protein
LKTYNFENCLIENNIITINGRGAGIYFEESSGTVNNCQILGNQNQGENTAGGGGVALWISEVFLNNSVINGNSTNLEGGGLYLRQSSEITISNSVISENIALKGGGVYYFESTGLNITNSQILNNSATVSHGGGIYAGYSPGGVTIDSTIFNGNHATGRGGGFYLFEPDTPHEYESSTIINSTLEGNLSNRGGSMYFENSVVMFENCNISNNSSTFIGGGLSFLHTTAELNNIILDSNHSDDSGAGIHSSYSNITINNSQLINNIALYEGGAISAGGSSAATHTFILNNTTIDSNTSGYQGGGLWLLHPGDIQINNCSITNNIVHETEWGSYGNGGGIVAKIGANPIITNSVISGNSATEGDLSENQGRGGGLYAEENGHFEIINSSIFDNHANRGGGLYLWYGADANISDSYISNNDATWGGGISIDNQYGQSILTLINTLISDNISNTAGGGLSATGISGSNVTIHDSKINNNISNDFAGGIFCQPCNLAINNSEITGNSALEYAGGIALNFTSPVNNPIFNNITVADNSAGAYGGGIFVGNGEVLPEIDISNSIVWSNTPDEIWLNNGYGDCTNVPTININYSDVNIDNVVNSCNSLNWSESNISEDPHFVEDYILQSNSPCIDTGNPDLDDDGIMWENDTDDQDPDGTRKDMGAYYFHQTLGCIDSLASNYDPEATIDDGSCIYGEAGCNDETAYNFNENAEWNDDSCIYYGDINTDGNIDVVDVIAMVGFVLEINELTPEQVLIGDLYPDGIINIYDIVSVISIIMSDSLLDTLPLTEVTLIQENNSLKFSKSGSIAGIQIDYEGEFESSLEGWLIEKNDDTILMISLDGSDLDKIYYSGDLKITSCSVVGWELNKIDAEVTVIPDQFSLKPAYPNPFNPETTINYAIPYDAYVVIKAFDVRGKEVADLVNGQIEEGIHEVVWDASKLSSGMYFVRMTSGEFKAVQKIIFLK